MYDWLREKLRLFELGAETEACALGIDDCGYETSDFINWLERTGASPWRSVEDGLPEQMVTVLLLEDEMVLTGHRDLLDNFWQHDSEGRDEWTVWPTHWMPLPPLPREGE